MNGDEEESSDLPSTPSLLGNGIRASFTACLRSASHKKGTGLRLGLSAVLKFKKKKPRVFNYFIEPSLTIRDER